MIHSENSLAHCDYTCSHIMLTILLGTNMEKYVKYCSRNNTEKYVLPIQTESVEKYANTICVFHSYRTYREICEHNLCISLTGNIYRNIRIVLAYFNHREPIEKYENTICVFHLQGTYGEIIELCRHISFAYFTCREHIEKYADCVGIFHSQGTYREICELCWCISFMWNKLRNMQIVLVYFTHMEYIEKYVNIECLIQHPKHLWRNRQTHGIPSQFQDDRYPNSKPSLPFPKNLLISTQTQFAYFAPI